MIVRKFFVLAHTAVVMLLAATLLNAYIPPSVLPGLNLLSLAFPGLFAVHLLLCLFWILLWKKQAVFFLAVSILFLNPVRRWLNYNPQSADIPTLKVVSANLKTGKLGEMAAADYLNETGAHLMILQDPGEVQNMIGLAHKSRDYWVVSTSSATEIIAQGPLFGEDGYSFYADIKHQGKVIRVINVYLTPFFFDKNKVRPAEDLEKNRSKAKYILKRLIPTFRIHEDEVDLIADAVRKSPYPVILAGDFNAVPNSYEYYTLLGDLKDAFVEVGRGSATSFHDYKVPIRIDYIFTSESIKAISYRVDRNIKISDHFPVIAEFKIE